MERSEGSTSRHLSEPSASSTTIVRTVDPAIHERLLRDYGRLKIRLNGLEKENEGLRASLWEVSWRWGRAGGKGKGRSREETEEDAPPVTTTSDTAPLSLTVPPSEVTTPTEITPTTISSKASGSTSPFIVGNLGTNFMVLNEPPAAKRANTTTTSVLPTTPASMAASLFPSRFIPHPDTAPSSTSSRAAPAQRDASLKRDLDISLPHARHQRAETRSSWKWGRGYDLKGHRAGVYDLEFSEGDFGERGRLLASAGFDGIRLWGPKVGENGEIGAGEGGDRDEEGDAWDDGDVEEFAHLTNHTGPVSSIAFSPTTSHLLSGGYDSQLHVYPLSAPPSSGTAPYTPAWSYRTEGLVQSVCWLHPNSEQGESGNLFAWGTSAKVLGLGDLRVEKPVLLFNCDTMVNSVQSFRRSPHLLVGDSSGQIRHFSLRSSSFIPSSDVSPALSTVSGLPMPPLPNAPPQPSMKKSTPISCVSLTPDWGRKGEPRWMARIGFDNLILVYDRGIDPLKTTPKLTQTLKGKNRNWPIKASWFQGRDYVDSTSNSKRNAAAASRTRSRSGSFNSDHPPRFPSTRHASDSDNEDEASPDKPQVRPLSSSLLLAAGSSDPVVLLYDLSKPIASKNGSVPEGTISVQRLEGHKESVYATAFLQAGPGSGTSGTYQGEGLLASAGGDCVVKIWKPVFAEEDAGDSRR